MHFDPNLGGPLSLLGGKGSLDKSFGENHYGSLMVSITLKNIPETLHQELKQRARLHHRSLNKELLATIEHAIVGNLSSQNVKLGSGKGLIAQYPLDDSLVTMNFGNEWEMNS